MGIARVATKIAGLALDARCATRFGDPRDRAAAARWIAANALAIRGISVGIAKAPPSGAHVFGVHTDSANGLLAVLATLPALVDATSLPIRWRLALRALGIPEADRPHGALIAGGASVVTLAADTDCVLEVEPDARGFRVRSSDGARALVA